ncbi:MAG: HEAT repeat domain-containing protein [archaeon]|nr:HEAT repeat domain-containing protein [archaeon]
MALDDMLPLILLAVGLLVFFFGFLLVFRNLKKINLIEGEKFVLTDWISCIAFGVMFSMAVTFMTSLILNGFVVTTSTSTSIMSIIGGIILIVLIAILVIYPLWEVIFLGRPTSDAVHDMHKFLENKILDRFPGKIAYFISFLIFVVVYLVPIALISAFTEYEVGEIAFTWFLIFPLFFLNYFAASGVMSGIIGVIYKNKQYIAPNQGNVLVKGNNIILMFKAILMIFIAWVPFFLAIYNIYSPISTVASGGNLLEQKDPLMAWISLFTTVVFGIKGFFQKFWNKKSKTKVIDFIFSGYIFIGIGVNMLINFIKISEVKTFNILEFEIGSITPLVIFGITNVFSNEILLLIILVIQSLITIFYGLRLYLDKKSDFYADVRLSAVNKAYGQIEIRTEDAMDDENIGKRKVKTPKYDLSTLFKSVLLPPEYNKFGLDINDSVRKKAGQYLLLICAENKENKELVQSIINNMAKNTIELPKKKKVIFISKDAVDLLGNIGTIPEYSDIMIDRLISALPKAEDTQMKHYILDALGDIGETKENLIKLLGQIKPLLISERYEIRRAACLSIQEMVLEGDNTNKEFVDIALGAFYEILDQHSSNENIIETTLEAILTCCAKVAKDVSIEKIIPFVSYNSDGKDQVAVGYVIEDAISIIASIVYFNLDKFPVEIMNKYLKDDRNFIRYSAADALGNFILKSSVSENRESIILDLMEYSLNDEDSDVTEMCAESITEFLVMNKGYQVTLDGQTISILDYYKNALNSSNSKIVENASEALKSIAPLYQEDIYPLLNSKIRGENLEVARDCLHTLALLGDKIHKQVDLSIIYNLSKHEDSTVRAEAVFCLGMLSENRTDIDENYITERLDDKDPTVRLEAIFALGKIGIQIPEIIAPYLIERFVKLIQDENEKVSEIELYAESLGIIGNTHPYNEIVIVLQQALMGDTNPFAKDVVVRAITNVGMGLIRTGKATEHIEGSDLNNNPSIMALLTGAKNEYTIGNIMIILIEALQQKGIPEDVMNEISDAMQDLLPVFLFVRTEKVENEILLALKYLLAQAYYSNYNQEILETIDRIDSLMAFEQLFANIDDVLKDIFLFYSKQYTPDGKQFHDQGEIFLLLEKQDSKFLDYALKSFEISIDLSPHEYYTPNAELQMAIIYKKKKDYQKAKVKFEEALETFASLDEIEKMKECEQQLEEIKQLL